MVALRVSLPSGMAEELVDDGLAVEALTTRGVGVGEVVHILVEGVTTGASLATVSLASAGLYRVAKRLVAHIRQNYDSSPVTVTVRGPRGTEVRPVDPDGSDVEETAEWIRAAVEAVGTGSEHPE